MYTGSRYYWMLVSPDKYELPIAIADTCGELAQMLGKTEKSVYNAVTFAERRGSKRSQFRRVLKEEGGDKNADA